MLRERKARAGQRTRRDPSESRLQPDEWWLPDLAAELSMPIATLQRWRRVAWVRSRKVADAAGRWALYADAEELTRLRRLRNSPRSWPQSYPTELITPKELPNE